MIVFLWLCRALSLSLISQTKVTELRNDTVLLGFMWQDSIIDSCSLLKGTMPFDWIGYPLGWPVIHGLFDQSN